MNLKVISFSAGFFLSIFNAALLNAQIFEPIGLLSGLNGSSPQGALVEGTNHCFYGTASTGGLNSKGTIFLVSTNNAISPLLSFDGTNGAMPRAGLVLATDGNFYGTTYNGGASNLGTAFRLTPDGILTTLVSFQGTNGSHPRSELLELNEGVFLGTTYNGGSNGFGTIFRITADGNFNSLFSFDGGNGKSPTDLLHGKNGEIYGITHAGSTNNLGTVFKFSTNGTLTTLISFSALVFDNAGLVLGKDGNLYGVTWLGGTNNAGSIFNLTSNGIYTTLSSFTRPITGGYPHAGLVEGSDGNFYGTTSQFGTGGYGTVYRTTSNGELTILTSFASSFVADAQTRLTFAQDGNLYGTTFSGTIFRIIMPVTLSSFLKGNELVLSWPTNQVGFKLQSALDLGSSTNWIDSTNSPMVNGSQFVVTNSNSGNAHFYRLKK